MGESIPRLSLCTHAVNLIDSKNPELMQSISSTLKTLFINVCVCVCVCVCLYVCAIVRVRQFVYYMFA